MEPARAEAVSEQVTVARKSSQWEIVWDKVLGGKAQRVVRELQRYYGRRGRHERRAFSRAFGQAMRMGLIVSVVAEGPGDGEIVDPKKVAPENLHKGQESG